MYKEFIFRNVSQHFIMQKGLSLEEGLILDYLISLYEKFDYYSPYEYCGKYYLWCTPNNIIKAFPLLNLSETRVIKIFNRLEYLNIIEQQKIGKVKYFHIEMSTMYEAASDDKYSYCKIHLDDERQIRMTEKITMLFKRGW